MNIIEEMYNGDLFPIGSSSHNNKEYKKVISDISKAESELLKAYPQARELFEKYQNAQIELITIDNRREFVNGFRIGAQMAMETMKAVE